MTSVLAIASATGQVSVAIDHPVACSSGGYTTATEHKSASGRASIVVAAGRKHGETLAPAIEALTELAGCPLSSIELVAVDAGPGLFTGLRVGLATAKALAAALGVPLAAGCSLDLLAEPHRHADRPVVSLVDARRSEVFWAVYRPGGGRLTEPAVAAPEKVALALAEYPGALLVGDGARRYADVLSGSLIAESYDHPSAAVLAAIAPSLPASAPEHVQAVYLRGADVRIGWATR